MDELYSDIILDHYRNPHNRGALKRHTARATEYNPLCGDAITMDVVVGKEGDIAQIKFSGEGCAISQASASLLTDAIIGKSVESIQKMSAQDVVDLLHIPISPGRMKCALLALSVAKKVTVQDAKIKKSICKKKKK